MDIDKSFIDSFIKSTARAAYGASLFKGKNDKIAADKAAVDEMRKELNKINMRGKIVIGEGEMDDAPMLYINEEVGTRDGEMFDIAVDPLEGTNFTAKDLPNALSVIAVTKKGNLLHAPDIYMDKIAIGPGFSKNLIDLDFSVEKKSYGVKGWLLFLVLSITLGSCVYFYIQKKGIDVATTLTWNLKKLFPVTPKTPSPLDNQSKETPNEPARIVVEHTEKTSLSEKIALEKENVINLLRNEIKSLKSELKRKNSLPPSQNFQSKKPHISGGFSENKAEKITKKKDAEPTTESETETSLTSSSSTKTEPSIQQNQIQKFSPQRSKEVQAYLDFIENTGSKFIELIKEGWARVQAFFL